MYECAYIHFHIKHCIGLILQHTCTFTYALNSTWTLPQLQIANTVLNTHRRIGITKSFLTSYPSSSRWYYCTTSVISLKEGLSSFSATIYRKFLFISLNNNSCNYGVPKKIHDYSGGGRIRAHLWGTYRRNRNATRVPGWYAGVLGHAEKSSLLQCSGWETN